MESRLDAIHSSTKTKFCVNFEFSEFVHIDCMEFFRLIHYLTADQIRRYTGVSQPASIDVDFKMTYGHDPEAED